jgi:hypothetical protein
MFPGFCQSMSTLSQRLAKLDVVERRRVMDERNAKRRAVPKPSAPSVVLWDDRVIDPDYDDLCNWYSADMPLNPSEQVTND